MARYERAHDHPVVWVTPGASRSFRTAIDYDSAASPRQDEDQCFVTFLAYRDHGFIRFTSERTGETDLRASSAGIAGAVR
jgi:hypothetical protein